MNFNRLRSLTGLMILLGQTTLFASSPADRDIMHSKRLTFNQPIEGVKFEGLSGIESWGRWSDGRLSDPNRVTMTFDQRLPRAFTLVLSAFPFGQNADADIVATVGRDSQIFRLPKSTTISLQFNYIFDEAAISFTVPHPTSPTPDDPSGDQRLIGIGFVDMLIEKYNPESAIPAGCIMAYAGSNAPIGWGSCWGLTLDCFDFPHLFHALGYAHTDLESVTTHTKFSIPNLRGKLIESHNDGSDHESKSDTQTSSKIQYIIKY